MSKTTKWIIVLIIIIVGGWLLWKNNMLPMNQSAAVINSTTTSTGNPTLDQINRDAASISAQTQASIIEVNAIGTSSSPGTVVSAANHLKNLLTLVSKTRTELESAISNKTTPALKATLTDLGVQYANASSQIGSALNNVKNIQGDATAGTNTGLKQAIVQLRISQTYLKVVQADIATISASLK